MDYKNDTTRNGRKDLIRKILEEDELLELDDTKLTDEEIKAGWFILSYLGTLSLNFMTKGYYLLRFAGSKAIRWDSWNPPGYGRVSDELAESFTKQSSMDKETTKKIAGLIKNNESVYLAQQLAKAEGNNPQIKGRKR